VRLRCYLPSTSAIVVILIVGFLLLHNAASHTFAAVGLATMIVMAVGAAGLVAGTIVVSAVLIRRRRAAAGACHTCSHPCREAMVPLPELDAPLWPHRPLSYLPGGQTSRMGDSRPPSPLAPVPPGVLPVRADGKERHHIGPNRQDEKLRGWADQGKISPNRTDQERVRA